MTIQIPLTVNYDSHYEIWMVRQASHAFAASMCPAVIVKGDFIKPCQYEFDTQEQAVEQVRRLNKWVANGGEIKFTHRWTDGLFETVADTKYGCAWN